MASAPCCIPCAAISVSTQPGHSAFTVIRRGASSSASARVKPITPCFDGAIRRVAGHAESPEHRRQVDDAPAVRQQRHDRARHQVDADEIVSMVRRQRATSEPCDRLAAADAGVVDEHVELRRRAPQRLDRRGDRRVARSRPSRSPAPGRRGARDRRRSPGAGSASGRRSRQTCRDPRAPAQSRGRCRGRRQSPAPSVISRRLWRGSARTRPGRSATASTACDRRTGRRRGDRFRAARRARESP